MPAAGAGYSASQDRLSAGFVPPKGAGHVVPSMLRDAQRKIGDGDGNGRVAKKACQLRIGAYS
jgi:hypothetical protein